jgi:hypothetical protein
VSFEAEADRAALAHVTDHVARGLSRRTAKWRDKQAIEAVLSSHLAETQELEDALWSIFALTLDTATDDQLAQYGALLGEPKLTLTDVKWREVLRARILANRSSGSIPDIQAVFAQLGVPDLEELFPAGLLASGGFSSTVPGARLGSLLRRATAGGVGAQLVVPASTETALRFASAEDVEPAVSMGFGVVDPSVGGHLAGVY